MPSSSSPNPGDSHVVPLGIRLTETRPFRTPVREGRCGDSRCRPILCQLAVEALDDRVLPATLSVGTATLVEGNAGSQCASVWVSLDTPSNKTVSVSYATGDGTTTAGSDYQATSGTLTIPAGQTTGTITVLVNGDRLAEANEAFTIYLSNPVNAGIADGQGVATIVDDEPQISISDVTLKEGQRGKTYFTFTVTLSAAYDQAVTVSYKTINGTATTGDNDYVAKSGTITFKVGETSKTITIIVNGDKKKESDETFYLDLFGDSSNSLITKSRGVGTILNDD